MKNDTLFHEDNTATYCPEDDKLRLYVGRVPREEYEALRAEGWTSTPKQDCDFVSVWTTQREDTAISYAGVVLDEDQGPEDRAADRAERFGGYLDKMLSEATGHADRYDAGPSAHGFQSKARAVRSADRHDRIGTRAVSAWDKAEYWQHRTAGVISHALYNSSPAVRMGRIKTIESDIRKAEKNLSDYRDRFDKWKLVLTEQDQDKALQMAHWLAGSSGFSSQYHHPREESRTRYDRENGTSLYSLLTQDNDPISAHEAATMWFKGRIDPHTEEFTEKSPLARFENHQKLRLAYEMQMLEAQGGRAALVEMEVGGWVGGYQIRKVNKSPATGRVVSVTVMVRGLHRWNNSDLGQHLETLNVERLAVESYRAPTDEDKAALAATIKAEKAEAPKKAPCPLVNPTLEEAERMQNLWNERHKSDPYAVRHGFKPVEVLQMTQAQYSEQSGGTYSKFETRGVCGNGMREPRSSNMWSSKAEAEKKQRGPAVCKVRIHESSNWGSPDRVIHITDKPAKLFPAAVWKAYTPPIEAEKVPA